jgi:hypothetical protein
VASTLFYVWGYFPHSRHGHIFSVGGMVATLGWGGGVYIPQTLKNFACGEQKKEGRRFLGKVFYSVEKNCHTPSQFWSEVWRSLEGIYPHTPHAHVYPIHSCPYLRVPSGQGHPSPTQAPGQNRQTLDKMNLQRGGIADV